MADYEASHGVVLGADDGISTTTNTVWDDAAALVILANSTERIGLRFTTLPTTSVGTQAGVAKTQTDNIYRTMTLGFGYITSGAGTVAVYLVDENDPTAFSNSRVPGGGVITERQVHSSTLAATTDTAALTLDMGVIGGALDGATDPYHGLGFAGNFSLTIEWTSTAGNLALGSVEFPALLTQASLTLVGVSWHSGIAGISPIGGRGHVDDRTGQFATEDDLIRDGYTDSLVLPENWDPPDENPIFDPIPRRFDKEL